nr:immunoglobulin light chain junction region [Macaca mulatta]MOW13807.1 immunoglobulin light chain junction region [Macaca mulatta]MOW40234.1 immunoglobulin light chain junction region [Macaca mulatta]MOW52604.1 immunoglobulin light chain junction region [Macaca mulatta]MOW54761.1 immunoglobulin light chain junction region [Macaca mulatta]
CLQYSSSPWTF